MSRVGWLLTVLLSLLLIIGWYFLVFDPTAEDIDTVRAETEQTRTLRDQQLARAEELREVRQNAPESEAALAAGELLIPESASVPALFRQLQQASDDAGVRLTTISPGSPSVQTISEVDVAVMTVSLQLEGSYFQIVDLARRIEDPLLTPRALRWTSAAMTPSEFPTLSVTLGGQVFARDVEGLPGEEEEEAAEDVADEDAADEDADIDPDVDPVEEDEVEQ